MKKLLLLLLLVTMQTFAGIPLSTNFTVNTALPIEDRMSVADETARDAIPALRRWEGMLVYVVADATHYALIGGTTNSDWGMVGGGGGISPWLTATDYIVGSVVIESKKIYQSLSIHTSGVFVVDLANGDWEEISADAPLLLTGEATNVDDVVTLDNDAVIAKELTGFTSAAGTITATDTILSALQKADGNAALKLGSTQSNVDVSPVATTQLNTPASQLTTVGTDTRLIETGNTNLLANPGFESNVVPTCTTGTPTLDAVTFFPGGKQSMKLAVTGTGGRCVFSIPSGTAAMLKGQQMFLRARINSTDSALKVCSVENGVDKNCKDVAVTSVNRLWDIVEIPFIADGTSNGLVIKTVTTSAQSIYVDDLVISTGLPNLVGLAGDTVYSAAISTTGVKSGENVTGWLSGNCAVSATSQYDCPIKIGIATTVLNCSTTYETNGTGVLIATYDIVNSTATNARFRISNSVGSPVAGTFGIICQKTGADYAAASSSAYLSTNGNTDWTPCTFSTLAWQGLGTVVNNSLQCRREGPNLEMKGSFTTGTTTASVAQIPLPNNYGTIVTQTTGLDSYGLIVRNNSAAAQNYSNLIGTIGLSYINISAYIGNAGNPNTPINGNAYALSTETQTLQRVSIPIQGWTNSNLIVGSFEGIEKCASIDECTDEYKAITSTVASGNTFVENTSFISSITGTSSDRRVNFTAGKFTVKPKININCEGGSAGFGINDVWAVSITGFNFRCLTGANATTDQIAHITAGKMGVDYKPKTAKIASSIGVPTVPGITTQAIDTFSVSYGTGNATTACSASPCSYVDQIGTAVASVTRTGTGVYLLNTVKTYSKLKCTSSVSAVLAPLYNIACSSCNSVQFASATISAGPAFADSYGSLVCQGSF